MSALQVWTGDDEAPVPASLPNGQHRVRGRRIVARPAELPPDIEAAIWRGDALGTPVEAVLPSGFAALDAQLPGGGWPCHSLTELLQPQPGVTEWRLLAPAMRQAVAAGGQVVVVGPPKFPHLPGLRHAGLDDRQLVWVQAEAPAERLWVTEQLVKANACGLLLSWLPQARPEQIRRLQVAAQGCEGLVFLCRPAAAEHEASAAPLRVQVRVGLDWQLHVHLLKRKGPTHEGDLELLAVPGGLEAILTPRLAKPSELIAARNRHETREASDVVGRSAPRPTVERRVAAH